ncbi:glycosyl hydrolase family 18 protein [Microbispora hainanensis]|uniref:chitinase n=1 Tax=Microbispora TaxID=2005 RepID=UPI00115874D4|nr:MULTISPECIES: glycosyl hydrolase family 18 protein [Microbispora]NJP28131.1 chitinase [Microbispora sp. CL1-1]TQS09486.1 chitinase [Microbispora sp. SCL1-1]
MKKLIGLGAAASVAFAGLLTATFTGPALAANIAANPGFESGLSGWTCASTAQAVSSPVHGGSGALSATPAGSDYARCEQTVTVRPSTTYALSAWVRGNYVFLGATGTGVNAQTWASPGSAWSQLSTSFTTGSSTTSVTIYVNGWYGQGTYFADDVVLDGPGTPPSPSPSPSASPSPSPSASPSASPKPSPSASPSPSPSAPPPPGGNRLMAGYLHASFANGSGYVRMADVPDAWDIIDLAFGEPTSPTSGDIRFTRCPATECPNVESDAEFVAAIRAKQAAGKKVLISIGGQNGIVQLTTTTARDKFVQSVSAIIDRYGLDGLDIDFEGHSLSLNAGDTDFRNPTTPVVVNLISAIKTLKARYGAKFTLTMAPETFFVQLGYQFYGLGRNGTADARSGAYLPVIHALRDDLTLLHVQDYNSGPIMGLDNQYHTMGVADFHVAMTDMLLTGFPVAGGATFPPLRPDQVAIGLPAAPYAGNGYTSTAEVQSAFTCLAKGTGCGSYRPHGTFPGLHGLMAWSVNWDRYAGSEFSRSHRAYLDALK